MTTIITYYECNKELAWLFLKDKPVKGLDEKLIKGKAKVNEYIRHRPNDEVIEFLRMNVKHIGRPLLVSVKMLSRKMWV